MVANTIARLEVTPSHVDARTGDVIDFAVKAKDAQGRELTGLTPSWTFAPGSGELDAGRRGSSATSPASTS